MTTEFTPLSALMGGIIIGCGIALLYWFNGRIAGVSGILGGAFERVSAGDRHWRFAFFGGLLVSGLLAVLLFPDVTTVAVSGNEFLAVTAGLLVGFGTRLGGGCTSGHGVCGLARFSRRSVVATILFMGSGMVVVFLMRHVLQAA